MFKYEELNAKDAYGLKVEGYTIYYYLLFNEELKKFSFAYEYIKKYNGNYLNNENFDKTIFFEEDDVINFLKYNLFSIYFDDIFQKTVYNYWNT